MFLKVNFIFLVVGHTKNTADRMFNTMKKKHRKSNAFTMKELCDGLESEKVNMIRLEKDDMKDWDGMLGKFYRKYPKIEEYHIFSCNWNDQAHTNKNMNVNVKESNVEGCQMYSFNSIKQGFEGRSRYPSGNKGLLAAIKGRKQLMKDTVIEVLTRPGINPYKQVELFKNYVKLMDEESAKITCPNPSEEVWDFVKAEKKTTKIEKCGRKRS